ncbi:MAG: DnaJ domain-containing protein [Candidatus Ranarchaeia archaeon]|jgi:curved DNA-binding protein CbpA
MYNMVQDYYQTLGIPKDASEEQITKAFKRLAFEWHPDRNLDPEAEAKFKEIGEAFSVLRDAQKRSEYDRIGHEEFSSHHKSDYGPEYYEDMLQSFINYIFRPPKGSKGRTTYPTNDRFINESVDVSQLSIDDVDDLLNMAAGGGLSPEDRSLILLKIIKICKVTDLERKSDINLSAGMQKLSLIATKAELPNEIREEIGFALLNWLNQIGEFKDIVFMSADVSFIYILHPEFGNRDVMFPDAGFTDKTREDAGLLAVETAVKLGYTEILIMIAVGTGDEVIASGKGRDYTFDLKSDDFPKKVVAKAIEELRKMLDKRQRELGVGSVGDEVMLEEHPRAIRRITTGHNDGSKSNKGKKATMKS